MSDIPECTEVVENWAKLFKRGNVSDLKDQLQCLCGAEDSSFASREQIAEYVCGKYSWDQVTLETLELYK